MSSQLLSVKMSKGFYPERVVDRESRLDKAIRSAFGRFAALLSGKTANLKRFVRRVNALDEKYRVLSEKDLTNELVAIRVKLKGQDLEFEQLVRVFALVREVADRRLGLRHYDVQLIGGWVLCHGMVAEMNTGEGKTLTATLPACVAAMVGLPVHIVTVNDYLAQRDAEWMRPIYEAFGLSVGVVTQGLSVEARRNAYKCDVTYCTNKELVFDYLKDRLVFGRKPSKALLNLERLSNNAGRTDRLCLRGLGLALVDEVDSILVDEARTPLIISGQGDNSYKTQVYQQALQIADRLVEEKDFTLDLLRRRLTLTEAGTQALERLTVALPGIWQGCSRREELIRQALTAQHLFHKDRDYLIKNDRVQIIDEFSGRTMEDRSWEQGLHQLIEAKECCEVTSQKEPLARISYQRFFRRYQFLSGMTGTAREVADELWSVYRLNVVSVPPHRPVIRQQLPNQVFRSESEKWAAVLDRICALHKQGRALLVGTRSVEASELLAAKLNEIDLPHRILNARQDQEEAEIIALAGQTTQITVATNMAGRGTDITLSPEVKAAGGLHVIATERHSARRIDRQLFGRCGRQGDPGSCESMVSLEDEVLALYRSCLLGNLLCPLVRHDRWLGRWFGSLYAGFCQWSTERKHFRMRRELLDLDEMLADALAFSGQGE